MMRGKSLRDIVAASIFTSVIALLTACGAPSEDPTDEDFVAPAFRDGGASENGTPADVVPGPTAGSVPLDEAPVAEIGDLGILRPRAMVLPTSAALYVTIVNRGGAPDRLLGITSEHAALIELHESLVEQGAMRMVAHPEGFAIEPGGHVALEPGGKHGMIIGLEIEDDADHVPLKFQFETAGEIALDVPIKDPTEILEESGR